MDADTKTTETQETEQSQPTISNADAKSLPWVQQMAEKLAAYERSEKERTETEANLAKQAELKKAEDEQRWQDVIKMREAELEQVKGEHQKQMLAMNLKTELMAAGFNNRVFMQGAIST